MKDITLCPFWTPTMYERVSNATSFSEVTRVALEILISMPKPVCMVCGPISTGGLGSYEKNILVFQRCVKELRDAGLNPFDQCPLQHGFNRLVDEWKKRNGNHYCMPILEEVYRPIFASRQVQTQYFLPGWKTSFGTTWEHATGSELGLTQLEYPHDRYERILAELRPQLDRIAA